MEKEVAICEADSKSTAQTYLSYLALVKKTGDLSTAGFSPFLPDIPYHTGVPEYKVTVFRNIS